MKNALLVGFDGFDPDVVVNLTFAYRQLGIRLLPSKTMREGFTLIVIARPPNKKVLFPLDVTIHIWDYVGNVIDEFLSESTFPVGTKLFTSSAERLENIRVSIGSSEVEALVQLPPVAVTYWRKQPLPPVYQKVHIGNRKPSYSDGSDPVSVDFLATLAAQHVQVWGMGWGTEIQKRSYHGKAKLSKVSQIYAKSQLAYGMMYPFQRGSTISGRFWQAPLSGCFLISESAPIENIPGVLTVAPEELPSHQARAALVKEASLYWLEHFDQCLVELSSHLRSTETLTDSEKSPSIRTLATLLARSWAQTIKWGFGFRSFYL